MFKRVLIANRGEIACRIIRTAKKLGIETVAVYSEVDRHAKHVRHADESYCIGPGDSSKSYLDIKKIIDVALKSGSDAIHAGYGFLAENPLLVEACAASGITFIGPEAETMKIAGDKTRSRELAQKLKIPVIPGIIVTKPQNPGKEINDFIRQNGVPLLVKAAAGGGGRGIRRVEEPKDLKDALTAAAREAKAFFSDERLFIEKLIEPARHIEVQIIADSHGNVIALSDRDCSMQRKHQKIIEEAPAPALPAALREAIRAAAVQVSKEINYTSAGTVEFLLGPDNNWYFLEINSRLQVEHPVTEEITGLDLVELQFKVAAGEKLKLPITATKANQVTSIECRICAEDPESGFLPQSGKILELVFPKSPSAAVKIRVDSGFESGDTVSHYYDSLLAKLIVTAATRSEAIVESIKALKAVRIAGLRTNIAFLLRLLESKEFNCAKHHVKLAEKLPSSEHDRLKRALLYAALALLYDAIKKRSSLQSAWNSEIGWRHAGITALNADFSVDSLAVNVQLIPNSDGSFNVFGGDSHSMLEFVLSDLRFVHGLMRYRLNQSEGSFYLYQDNSLWASGECGTAEIKRLLPVLKQRDNQDQNTGELITSNLPGQILSVKVKAGDRVSQGDLLTVLESMKMEHRITASHAAVVKEVLKKSGEQVRAGEVLIRLENT
ncbi:MAG: biotin/lipoyl-binding protein [Candidatus Dadabacteria bacterium]|nr:MAG: biotin/lipoyl-binding protein [Candidatus Dadabacteria bacterium]